MASAGGPTPLDRAKIGALVWTRRRNHRTVDQGTIRGFRRRRIPSSGMPQLVAACDRYPNMRWAPKELIAPATLPAEARLPRRYRLSYYGLAKASFRAHRAWPVDGDLDWDPTFDWNDAFPETGDGWAHPTADDTFARLRLQGPNPWLLRRVEDTTGTDGAPEPTFELDLSTILDGVLPPLIARFAVRDERFVPTGILVGETEHRPGDPTWDRAKRVVNAADLRYVVFGRHLLDTHLIVGQAYALATYSLPTWHPLRPFMQFFTYGTLAVNDIALGNLIAEGSYWIDSGFATVDDADRLYDNLVPEFSLDDWLAPADVEARGIDAVPGHPYVDDALLVWPAFVEVVERHLDEIGYDDATIAADTDLQIWYLTLAKLIPNLDHRERTLDRERLGELCTILLWNNVVHEICGDMSPILGSVDPRDKTVVNLARLRASVGERGELADEVEAPSASDVFLMDQASFVSRFNVGGNNILAINAARLVDDPRLRDAIRDLQATLRDLEVELVDRNEERDVRFARMLPRHWEASISF
ncbi:MAG: lipoxygenase family protein [Actinomycetota bacterium]